MRLNGASSDDDDISSVVGLQIGAYRLVEKIGEGGMGDVFRAERADGLFAQQVAVKITRSTIGDSDLRRRFSVERQILASLNHDNIVRLLDGGTTTHGQAFLIMEHVEGVPLTQHCREGRLSLEARLRLFCLVCRGVQYAHQHGVVHRDLKPANILVTADHIPKVVDFGVAKLLEGRAGSGFTSTGVVPGPLTPNYASPEQIGGLPVTTSSDVYALGVVLYEIVAGVRPYETQGLPLERVIEVVLHEQPPRPSQARDDAASALPYGKAHLRGDIDAIVLKAMSKEPGERYASASELASDISRRLQGEPVLARAPSSLYVLRRLAWRHKRVAAVVALALAGVLAASGVATWQWRSARREQARAERRFDEVRKLANAIIFKIHDAVLPLPGSTPVRQMIVNEAIGYLDQLEAESGNNIPLRLELAAAHRQIGDILGNAGGANLGDRDGAIKQYERALSLVGSLPESNPSFDAVAAVVNVELRLSTAYLREENRERGLKFARDAAAHAEAYERRQPNDDRGRDLKARTHFGLAAVLRGPEATKMWLQTLADYEQLLASRPDDDQMQRNVALVGKYLGSILEIPNPSEARKHYMRSLELDEKRLSATPSDPRVQFDAAISYSNVAAIDELSNHPETALPLFEKSLALRRQLAAADPANVQTRDRLAYLLVRMAQFEETRDPKRSRRLSDEAIQILMPLVTATNDSVSRQTVASAWYQIGVLERMDRRTDASCAAFRRAQSLYAPVQDFLISKYHEQAQRVASDLATCSAGRN